MPFPDDPISFADANPRLKSDFKDLFDKSPVEFGEISEIIIELSKLKLSALEPDRLRRLRSPDEDDSDIEPVLEAVFFDGRYGPDGRNLLYKLHLRARDHLGFFVVRLDAAEPNAWLLRICNVIEADTVRNLLILKMNE